MNLQLQNKVIIVTGGSKGIGHAITHVLADEGAIPFISSATVQGSTGTEFFKKVYGEPAWAKLKTVANHMGFEGDNAYSMQV